MRDRFVMFARPFRLLPLLLLSLAPSPILAGSTVVGNGTPASCTEAAPPLPVTDSLPRRVTSVRVAVWNHETSAPPSPAAELCAKSTLVRVSVALLAETPPPPSAPALLPSIRLLRIVR